ncbi:MAG: flavin reductase family protein [Bacteroidota bacterium]|nr:flavin reductase family protein [Bacteroidota bacterium]MDP4226093.1 flavin reductase family protein [Bacteroidota bacterium]MDP4274181.1 flavin reductase family protein [Bacteroidota bacterium]
MGKITWKPGTMIYPLPAVMVSCGDSVENYNIMTVAWTGTICTNPPMCYISLRPERLSHELISRTREFAINLTNADLAYATDWCGVKSGREVNKFEAMKLTPLKAEIIKAPLIAESPVNIECRVKDILPLGSHDMFIAEIVAVHADDQYFDPQTGVFNLSQAHLISYSHGKYYVLGNEIGRFGFSVKKRKRNKKNY